MIHPHVSLVRTAYPKQKKRKKKDAKNSRAAEAITNYNTEGEQKNGVKFIAHVVTN